MRMIAAAILLAPVAARGDAQPPAPAVSNDTNDDGAPRLSLPTEADRDAWTRPGFRFGLGVAYGRIAGIGGPPGGSLLGAVVRAGVRLDRDWSLMLSFHYALASASHELSGIRFSGTIEPTWHVTGSLSLAIGLGFGGIVEGSPDRPDVAPLPSTLESSYTFPDARTPLPSCSGIGPVGAVRVEWAQVIGPRAALTIGLEGIAQATHCIADTGRLEPDTARPIERHQLWSHLGAQLALGITWR
jgi:hypothetical protein